MFWQIGGTQQVQTDNATCFHNTGSNYLSSGALLISSPGSRDYLTIPAGGGK